MTLSEAKVLAALDGGHLIWITERICLFGGCYSDGEVTVYVENSYTSWLGKACKSCVHSHKMKFRITVLEEDDNNND